MKTAAAGSVTALAPLGLAVAQDAAPAAPAAPAGEMVICRWQNAPAPDAELKTMAEKLTREAVKGIGGMERFVKKDFVVWVKPNMAWNRTPEQAANTNPDVVATLVRMCFEAGAKTVKVGDMTCNEAKQAYPTSGIEAAAKEAGAEIVYIDETRFRDMEIGGQQLKTWPVYPDIVETDLVINVPVVKHHSLATATMCMKNYMGVVGGQRNAWHQQMPDCLCDITAFMKPSFCVLDAIRILTANGPTGGDLKDVKRCDTVAAGTDIVALDAFGATLLGHEPAQIASVQRAQERGLGQMDYMKFAKEILVS